MTELYGNSFLEDANGRNLSVLTEFFKALGNPTRIRILFLLMEREACAGELAEQLSLTQSAVSHQLNLLRSSKLVKCRRDGKWIIYSLADAHVRMVVEKGVEHVLDLRLLTQKKF